MNLGTIEMDRSAAKQAFRQYRDAVRERHDAELEQIMNGYRELARGRQVISLQQTIAAGGVGDDGLPRRAICLADERWCDVEYRRDGSVTFKGWKQDGRFVGQDQREHRSRLRRVRVPEGTLPTFDDRNRNGWTISSRGHRMAAMVPIVPPPL